MLEIMSPSGIGFKSTRPKKLQSTRRKLLINIVDKIVLKVEAEYIWLGVAIEPENRQIWHIYVKFDK
jgi:hypothetical protein